MSVNLGDGEVARARSAADHSPIILDLGKQKKKAIKQLRKGEGKVLDEVWDAIGELRTAGTISESAQPIIVIVREKRESELLSILGK